MTTKKAVKKEDKQEDKQLVFLRRLVKTLGVILIVGTIFVVSVVIIRLVGSTKSGHIGTCSAVPEDIQLPVAGDIISMQREEKILTLAIRDKDGQKIVIIDLCNGKVVQTVWLESVIY
jgi:hypothetical protein